MKDIYSDYWHFANLSRHSLQPPINPTSYFSAIEYLREVDSHHGLSADDLINIVEEEGLRTHKLSNSIILKVKIEKQSAALMWEYRKALEKGFSLLADMLLEQLEILFNQPMSLALLEILAGANSKDELGYFLDDLQATALLYDALEWNYLIQELPANLNDLRFQGIFYSSYFCCLFPGKEE